MTQRYSVTPQPIETLLPWAKTSEINIAIGDKAPEQYFQELVRQCDGGKKKYGGITEEEDLRANLRMHCIPKSLLVGETPACDDFLEERRKLMAQKTRSWFEAL